MSKSFFRGAAAVSACLLAASGSAYCAGFQLTEQSVVGMGRAYGGAGIVGDDLSAAYYNPAGLTLLPGTRYQVGSGACGLDIHYNAKSGHDDMAGAGVQPIPHMYLTHQINDSLWASMGITVPFAMVTDYSKDFEGSSRGNYAYMRTVDFNPSLAWRVNDRLSIGGGVSMQYAKAKLGASSNMGPVGNVYAKITATSWAPAWNVGGMYSFSENTRVGLSYRSRVKHSGNGQFSVHGIQPAYARIAQMMTGLHNGHVSGAETMITTPDWLMLTGTTRLTDKLRLSGMVRWAHWDNFQQLVLRKGSIRVSDTQNHWKSTWLFTAGADYDLTPSWTVRAGTAYETTPLRQAEDRIGIIPDSNRVWLTAGASWRFTKDLTFDAAFMWLHAIGNSDLYDRQGAGRKKLGDFRSNAYLAGIQAQYRFW